MAGPNTWSVPRKNLIYNEFISMYLGTVKLGLDHLFVLGNLWLTVAIVASVWLLVVFAVLAFMSGARYVSQAGTDASDEWEQRARERRSKKRKRPTHPIVTIQTLPQFLRSENEQSMSYGLNVLKIGGESERLHPITVLDCEHPNMRIQDLTGSQTLATVKRLVASGDVRISEHGYDELRSDSLSVREIVSGIDNAVLVEDYPEFPRGASVLVHQTDKNGEAVRVVWGIPKGHKPSRSSWDRILTRSRTVEFGFQETKNMKTRKRIKYVHEGEYVAEVDVELIVTDNEWAPYLSLEDAYKLDDIREALRRGDVEEASKTARVFKMRPIAM
jgi:hypothetical protein